MEERTWSKAPQRRCYHHPSFSSTLLDAIYRSIDDDDSHSTVAAGPSRTHAAAKKSTTADRRNASASERSSVRRRASASGSGLLPPISTSSSSDNSSYGGFSSSEPESATVHPSGRLRPIRTAVDAVSAPTRSSARIPPLPPPKSAPSKLVPSPPSPLAYHGQEEQETKKKTAPSIRSKLRDLRKSKTPASPGARLAGFINSLFASASGKPRKPKGSPAEASSVDVRHSGSACSAAPSYSRSCLVNTPSSRGSRDAAGKRSVRFYPVSVIVDEDLRPCGQKSVYEEDLAAPPRPSAAGGRAEREAKRRAEELLRRHEEEDDEDGGGSDSSSDLFELEIGRGAGAGFGYRDELPVYETTNHHIIGSNRPISHIF